MCLAVPIKVIELLDGQVAVGEQLGVQVGVGHTPRAIHQTPPPVAGSRSAYRNLVCRHDDDVTLFERAPDRRAIDAQEHVLEAPAPLAQALGCRPQPPIVASTPARGGEQVGKAGRREPGTPRGAPRSSGHTCTPPGPQLPLSGERGAAKHGRNPGLALAAG